MRVIDLFSGIGGFSLGLQMAGGFETVQFVEIEPFAQRVLAQNFPGVPIHDDIKTYQPDRGAADVVCGGFPCQPYSVAGKRRGTADDRDLWPEMRRVIDAVRPAWVVGENVSGFVKMELDRSISDLEALGYEVRCFVIPACAVAAPHRRDRVWIVAYADQQRGCSWNPERKDAADAGESPGSTRHDTGGVATWLTEPSVGRVANGVPRRVDRLKGLGNAVVPQVVEVIGRAIMAAGA